MSIYEQTYPDQKAHLFVWEGRDTTLCKPFISRAIPQTELSDISSVYGYGGPIATRTPDRAALADFDRAFVKYAKTIGAVSEFCLLHPLLDDTQKELVSDNQAISYRKEVVVVDLSQPLSRIWSHIEDRQRKAILAARKAGLIVRVSDMSDTDLDDYHSRYLETMRTVEARDFWHFPGTYFHNCRDALGNRHVSLFHAEKDGKTVASVFHIHMYDTVYYHFSCSDPAAKHMNATPLLLLDSLIWAKGAGFRWFHLGGGRTDGEDPLFTFKHAFSGQTKPLFSTQRVIDGQKYQALTEATLDREAKKFGRARETSFFPRYRLQT